MKKILGFIFIFASLFFYDSVSAKAEEIKSFDVSIVINKDASVLVSESIAYDFGTQQRHGIFRDIPIKYSARGGNYSVKISDISVFNEKGLKLEFTKSNVGKNLQIKIGDPNSLISGQKTYIIQYKISKVINYFSDQDEFYWNVTGNDWPVGIGSASAQVAFSESVDLEKVKTTCFEGFVGDKNLCSVQKKNSGNFANSIFFSQSAMSLGKGLTIVVGFPKGTVVEPTAFEKVEEIFKDNWILSLPVFVLIFMVILWYTKGRDPEGRGTIIAQFDVPDELTPMEVSTILKEDVTTESISSEIVSLASRGYIKIERIEDDGLLGIGKTVDYRLQKLKSESDENLKNYAEKDLLKGLFAFKDDVSIKKDLENKFYKTAESVSNSVYENVADKGYFLKNPKKIRKFYYTGGIILIGTAIGLAQTIADMVGIMAIASIFFSGVIVASFGHFMPAKTLKGVRTREHILGLKTYLNVAEKDRMEFHNAPEKNPQRFEKLLPYAMALGVEKKWAEQFEGIHMDSPGWYVDQSNRGFSPILFVNDLNHFSDQSNSAITSKPGGAAGGSSGFGGSSGGGFGGGGGGSW